MKLNTIGAFEANTDDFMLQLWFDLQPFIKKQSSSLIEDKIFNGIIDFLEENQGHWIWSRLDTELSTEDSVYESITNLSKQLSKSFSHKLWKPVKNNFGEIVEWEEKQLIKDKIEIPKWKKTKTYKTPNNILVRFSTKNEIALKGFTTKGLIMSVEDFQVFCNQTKLDLNTLSPHDLEKLIIDQEMTSDHQMWKSYPTMRTFDETMLVELGVENKPKQNKEQKYQIGKGFSIYQEKNVNWKEIEDTLDIFDFE